jgi:hypothetical protein
MSLSKSKISNWIEQRFADDYFRFDLICSEVTVLSYEQDGSSLRVDYKFWDDGHSISDNQQNFLFNIKLADEYGVNFPAQMQLVHFIDKFYWQSALECEELSVEPFQSDNELTDVDYYDWGDPLLDKWIKIYIDKIDKESMADMLIEQYDAKNGLPTFIPNILVPYFQEMVTARISDEQ